MDEFHVIVVGRPNHSHTRIYLLGPGPKGRCIVRAEDEYRKENWLKMNIALASRCVFSGSEGDGRAFMVRMEEEVGKQRLASNVHSVVSGSPQSGENTGS